MSGCSTIIFDFDGVILDSAGIKLDAFVQVYHREAEEKQAAVRNFARLNGGISRRRKFEYFEKTLFSRVADASSLDVLCHRYGQVVDDQLKTAQYIAGALEAITQLHECFSLHVVSGAPEADLRKIMEDRNIIEYFSVVSGAPQLKLEAFRHILSVDQVTPQEALAIGDSLTEYDAAATLGIPFLAVVADRNHDPFPEDVPRIRDLKGLLQLVQRMEAPSDV